MDEIQYRRDNDEDPARSPSPPEDQQDGNDK